MLEQLVAVLATLGIFLYLYMWIINWQATLILSIMLLVVLIGYLTSPREEFTRVRRVKYPPWWSEEEVRKAKNSRRNAELQSIAEEKHRREQVMQSSVCAKCGKGASELKLIDKGGYDGDGQPVGPNYKAVGFEDCLFCARLFCNKHIYEGKCPACWERELAKT
ncbi:MAG: hypothetical protein AAB599_03270 [Patescibacteria group bacterium]